jgi:D-3-phosphoglycerate dehydrogenase / 2-oxoglutarate reductase
VTSLRILAAGDHFVGPELLEQELRARVDHRELDFVTLTTPWPLEPYGPVGEVEEASGSEDEVAAAIAGAEVAVVHHAPVTRRVLEAANGLRIVVCTRGGPVNVNVDAATERGVAVSYAPGRNAPAAAEYAIGLLLAAMRRIPETHAELRGGAWRSDYYAWEHAGLELGGATVGLIGYGAIGRRMARLLDAFGAQVLIADPYLDPAAIEVGEPVEVSELLERSHVVSLHARLSDETRGMIGAAELARMPRGAVLVNTARGELVDSDALCDALESGQLAAAALDVFEQEPLPATARLLRAPRLVATPHLAGATRQTARRAARIAAEEVARYAAGEPLRHVVDPAAVTGAG